MYDKDSVIYEVKTNNNPAIKKYLIIGILVFVLLIVLGNSLFIFT